MKRKLIFLLSTVFLLNCSQKGTKENPIEGSSINWGKLTHLKYQLYQSNFLGKKSILEKITYYNPDDKKFYSFYQDQMNVEEPKKTVILTYSYVIDLPTYKELKGTFYALDKNRVYFLDTVKRERRPLYFAEPKSFKTLSPQTAKDKNYYFNKDSVIKSVSKNN